MTLLDVVDGVREKTWAGLKEVMSKYANPLDIALRVIVLIFRNLIQAAEALKWPTKIIYPNVPAAQRRAFERGYQDLLYLQAEYVLSSDSIISLRLCCSNADESEGKDSIQQLMEIGRKEMDYIPFRLLLRGLNCGSDIISKEVGIRTGLIRYVPLSVYSLLHLQLVLVS